jgi:hypothetical protein
MIFVFIQEKKVVGGETDLWYYGTNPNTRKKSNMTSSKKKS